VDHNTQLFQGMVAIHQFETPLIAQFKTWFFSGTIHTSLGQDASAVGVLVHLAEENVVAISNYYEWD